MSAAIDTIAGRQLGLITLVQLFATGLSPTQVHRLVAAGTLIPFRRGVYRLAGAPQSWEQAVLATALSAGRDAVVSHATAAAIWNLRHSERYASRIHVSGQRQTRIHGVISHRIRLTPNERTVAGAIPITTVARTILDWGPTLSPTQLGQCVDDAIRRRMVGLERLRRLVEEQPPRGGQRRLGPLRQVLAERSPGYRPDESDFETEMNRLWDRLGLPPARRQYRVTVDGHNYRLDRALPECRIGIEWDSYRFHSTPSDREYDSNRRARLAGAGWLIIPVTANAKPELIAQAVLRAYQDRTGAGEAGAAV